MNRSVVAVVSVAIGLGLLTGCSSEPDPSRAGTLAWIRDRPEVTEATVVREASDPSNGDIEITLEDGTSDREVEGFVDAFRDHFNAVDEPYSYRLRVDDFIAAVADHGPDDTIGWEGPPLGETLDRALWLRRDGRATAYDDARGASSYEYERITASGADVPQLALDLDAYDSEVAGDEPWGIKVASPDGNSVISWSRQLDRAALEPLVHLQRLYPGTTGLSGDGDLDVVLIDPADIGAAQLARLPDLLEAAGVPSSITGWGPVVFDSHRQLRRLVARPENRHTYAALAQVGGLGPSLEGSYGHPRDVLATDETSLHGALAILGKHSGGILGVGYSPEPGVNQAAVVRAEPDDSRTWLRAVDTVVGMPDVLSFGLYPGPSEREGNVWLGFVPTISDEDLRTILAIGQRLAPDGLFFVAAGSDPARYGPNSYLYDALLNADGTVEGSDDAGSEDADSRALVQRLTGLWAQIA